MHNDRCSVKVKSLLLNMSPRTATIRAIEHSIVAQETVKKYNIVYLVATILSIGSASNSNHFVVHR
jgi:hypothetical protein